MCEITLDGDVIRTYDSGDVYALSKPRHLAIDENSYIYIADMLNSRVLVLDSNLSLCKVIRTGNNENDEGHTRRLCYSQDTKQLIIGLHGGRVLIQRVLI